MICETMSKKRKILFFVTEDWAFCSHRLSLARAAMQDGFTVVVATRVQEHGQKIQAEGCKLIPLLIQRRNNNILTQIRSLFQLIRIYKSEQPDIVHHVAIKPVIFGSVAARIAGVPRVINAITGMGYVFSSSDLKAKIIRPFIKWSFRILLNRSNTRTIFQNPDDQYMLIHAGVVRTELTKLIRGSGVDPQAYFPVPEPPGIVTVILASRMLRDKGIYEFIEAVRLLKKSSINARFVLVGDTDSDNPTAVPTAQLEAWQKSGIVEWWGKRDDMQNVFASAHIVCLPSYREGVPKVLIEAASCGRAIVTTNAPGCREIVRDNENGLLVPVRDHEILAKALRKLIDDHALRSRMGEQGRKIVLDEFTSDIVAEKTLSLYKSLFLSIL